MKAAKMSKLILYHGSPEIIQTPVFGKGKSYNDYGKGFYCTEHLELAKEWACTENTDGYVNKYEIDTADLSVINLSSIHDSALAGSAYEVPQIPCLHSCYETWCGLAERTLPHRSDIV